MKLKSLFGIIALVAALDCNEAGAQSEMETARVINEIFSHATQLPPDVLKIRALICTEQPAWTVDQVNAEVQSQLKYVPAGTSPELIRQHTLSISNAVTKAHSGKTWVLFQETKVPGLYRLDIKEFWDDQPTNLNTLTFSNNVFNSYHINNYKRNDLDYRESHALNGQIVIDNSDAPVKWSQENLYAAKYMEPEAIISLMALVVQKTSPLDQDKVRSDMLEENKGVLGPTFNVDQEKLRNLIAGKAPGWTVDLKKGNAPGTYTLALTVLSENREGSAQYEIDENLPYLIRSVEQKKLMGAKYSSNRDGVGDLGFPESWVVTRQLENGAINKKTVNILFATTNVDFSVALATNRPAAFQVWERYGNNLMRSISGVSNKVTAAQSPFANGNRQTKAFYSHRMIILSILAVFFMAPLVYLAGVAFRNKK